MNKNDLIRDRDVLKKYVKSLSKTETEQHILDYLEDAIEWNPDWVISIVEEQLQKPLETIYQETIYQKPKGLFYWQIALVIVLLLLIVRSV